MCRCREARCWGSLAEACTPRLPCELGVNVRVSGFGHRHAPLEVSLLGVTLEVSLQGVTLLGSDGCCLAEICTPAPFVSQKA